MSWLRILVGLSMTAALAACGGGGGGSSAPASVQVTNTAPTITDPGALSLLEGGTTVATISASDAQNNSLSFSIASGDDQELFAITTGGDLSFVSAPDFESPADADTDNVYEVAVQVSDGSLTDTQAPTVSVITLMTSYLEILMKPVSIISTGLKRRKK